MPASEERVLERLNEQLRYYGRHAAKSRLAYLSVMTVKVAAAAAVSLTAVTGAPTLVTAGLGALILVLEGVQQLGQFHANWIRYRTTEAALSREQHLWEAGADDYAAGDPLVLLATRVETISANETSAWAKDAAGTPPGTK